VKMGRITLRFRGIRKLWGSFLDGTGGGGGENGKIKVQAIIYPPRRGKQGKMKLF